MASKTKNLETEKQHLDTVIAKTFELIDYLGTASSYLYENLNSIQNIFDEIRGIPDETRLHYQKLQEMRKAWKKQADDIQKETKKATKNTTPNMSNLEIGVVMFFFPCLLTPFIQKRPHPTVQPFY